MIQQHASMHFLNFLCFCNSIFICIQLYCIDDIWLNGDNLGFSFDYTRATPFDFFDVLDQNGDVLDDMAMLDENEDTLRKKYDYHSCTCDGGNCRQVIKFEK